MYMNCLACRKGIETQDGYYSLYLTLVVSSSGKKKKQKKDHLHWYVRLKISMKIADAVTYLYNEFKTVL